MTRDEHRSLLEALVAPDPPLLKCCIVLAMLGIALTAYGAC